MPERIAPVLELFRLSEGQYSLRLTDMRDNHIALALAKLLPDIQTLQLITPSDMKVFHFNEPEPPKVRRAVVEQMPEQIPDEEGMPPDEAPPVVRRMPRDPQHPNTVCGRCGGSGEVAAFMEDGQPAKGACPVCQGKGEIIGWGHRR